MRRVFFHADEFGEPGMVYLPYLACVSDPLVVWGPSPLLLKGTYEAFLTPHDLLWLVDQPRAPVRIIGRQEWLLDKQFRNAHPWPLARWVEEFDGVIKRLAIEDERIPLPSRRVIIAEPEKSYDKVDEILESSAGQSVARHLRLLYKNRLLPPGIFEKAQRARTQRLSVPRAILRDIQNHSRAMVSSDAYAASTPCEHMAVLQRIVPDSIVTGVTSSGPPGRGLVSHADLREAAQVLSRVAPAMTMRELRVFLKSSLKRDLHFLMYSPRSLASLDAHLTREVNEATTATSLFKLLFQPNDTITYCLTVGGLALSLTALFLSGNLEWALISVAVEAIKSPLRKYSLIREAVRPGHEAGALFYLTSGNVRPRRRQIQELLSRLKSGGSS